MRRLELYSGDIANAVVGGAFPRGGVEADALARLETDFAQVSAERGVEVEEGVCGDGGDGVRAAAGAGGEGGWEGKWGRALARVFVQWGVED